ncbi:MAG: hypothetical protein K0S44_2307 [Bacteroidetes bacterium]|jgi:hypothetical protein|nr:hypothetical protein [Bacteroidota bacterium]
MKTPMIAKMSNKHLIKIDGRFVDIRYLWINIYTIKIGNENKSPKAKTIGNDSNMLSADWSSINIT